MPSIELTAKSVQEATKTAAQKLGVGEKDVKVTVIEETKGLFGKSTLRVRAEAKEAVAATAPSASEKAVVQDTKPTRGRRGAKPVEEKPQEEERPSAPVAEVQPPAPEPEAAAKGRGRRKVTAPVAEGPPPAGDQGPEEEEEPARAVVATDADAEQLLALVRTILASGQLEVTARIAEKSGRYVNIEIDGTDVAFLVGKHGEVLNALQYLINIIAGRKYANGVRATLDGNHYRQRREGALTSLAEKIAEQVKERGEEAVLDALPAFERRIVHKALSEYNGVQTYSEGEEPNRRVVIAPAD